MTKLVSPYPPLEYDPDFLPNACWWRYAVLNYNEDKFLYTVTTDGDIDSARDPTWIAWEWFDGLDKIIDAGMDTPTVAAIWLVYIEPIDYIDLLAEEKPTKEFNRITEYGDRVHPGTVVCMDLDWKAIRGNK